MAALRWGATALNPNYSLSVVSSPLSNSLVYSAPPTTTILPNFFKHSESARYCVTSCAIAIPPFILPLREDFPTFYWSRLWPPARSPPNPQYNYQLQHFNVIRRGIECRQRDRNSEVRRAHRVPPDLLQRRNKARPRLGRRLRRVTGVMVQVRQRKWETRNLAEGRMISNPFCLPI